jgi:hypothetical protein
MEQPLRKMRGLLAVCVDIIVIITEKLVARAIYQYEQLNN